MWENNFTLVELSDIMRQKDDHTLAHMLNRIRTGTQTPADIDKLKFKVVNKSDFNYPTQAVHIFPRKKTILIN